MFLINSVFMSNLIFYWKTLRKLYREYDSSWKTIFVSFYTSSYGKTTHPHSFSPWHVLRKTVDSFVFLQLKFDGFAWKQFSCHINYFFLCHLFYIIHCDSIITRSPHGSQIFFQYICVKMSADDRGIHNASCENRTPCVFPSQVWQQLIFSEAVSTHHSIYNAYVIGDHV